MSGSVLILVAAAAAIPTVRSNRLRQFMSVAPVNGS
jgi:hypothetical protein